MTAGSGLTRVGAFLLVELLILFAVAVVVAAAAIPITLIVLLIERLI